MRFSPALVAVTAAALAVPSGAAANSVSPTSNKAVSANVSVSTCGSLSGIATSWTVVDGVVNSIALSNIPSACNGGLLSMTLVDASNNPVGTITPITIAGTTATLAPGGNPDATTVVSSYVSVVGP